jgi:hypothetical protein
MFAMVRRLTGVNHHFSERKSPTCLLLLTSACLLASGTSNNPQRSYFSTAAEDFEAKSLQSWICNMIRPLLSVIIAPVDSGESLVASLVLQKENLQISGEIVIATEFLSHRMKGYLPSAMVYEAHSVEDMISHAIESAPIDFIVLNCSAMHDDGIFEEYHHHLSTMVSILSATGVIVVTGINRDRDCWNNTFNRMEKIFHSQNQHRKAKNGSKKVSNYGHSKIVLTTDGELRSGFFLNSDDHSGLGIFSVDAALLSNLELTFPGFQLGTIKYPLGLRNVHFPNRFEVQEKGGGASFELSLIYDTKPENSFMVQIAMDAYDWQQFVAAMEGFILSNALPDEAMWLQVIVKLVR